MTEEEVKQKRAVEIKLKILSDYEQEIGDINSYLKDEGYTVIYDILRGEKWKELVPDEAYKIFLNTIKSYSELLQQFCISCYRIKEILDPSNNECPEYFEDIINILKLIEKNSLLSEQLYLERLILWLKYTYKCNIIDKDSINKMTGITPHYLHLILHVLDKNELIDSPQPDGFCVKTKLTEKGKYILGVDCKEVCPYKLERRIEIIENKINVLENIVEDKYILKVIKTN